MENNIRFRNHISIIFEQMGSVIIFLVIMAGTGFVQNFQQLKEKDLNLTGLTAGNIRLLMTIALGALGCLIVLILWQLVVWSKTYISIQDNALILEKNTLNKKKHTIGIKNISNVNTEQNLFEMLLGTCKLKLDTNTLSTADKTDVKIVLKKKDAEKFRSYLVELMQQSNGSHPVSDSAETPVEVSDSRLPHSALLHPDREMANETHLGLGEMLIHGFFSINLFSLLVVLGTLVIAGQTAFDSFPKRHQWKRTLGNTDGIYDGNNPVFFCFVGYRKRLYPLLRLPGLPHKRPNLYPLWLFQKDQLYYTG